MLYLSNICDRDTLIRPWITTWARSSLTSFRWILLVLFSRSAQTFCIGLQMRVSNAAMMVLGHLSFLLWSPSVDQCDSTSLEPHTRLELLCIFSSSSRKICSPTLWRSRFGLFSRRSPDRSVPNVLSNSTTGFFASSALGRLWYPSAFASSQISYHDWYDQCVNAYSKSNNVSDDVN